MVKKLIGREQRIGILRVGYEIMKPAIHIELDELIEYRDDLNNMIKAYEQLNIDWDVRRNKLVDAGYDLVEVNDILSILFGEIEVDDNE